MNPNQKGFGNNNEEDRIQQRQGSSSASNENKAKGKAAPNDDDDNDDMKEIATEASTSNKKKKNKDGHDDVDEIPEAKDSSSSTAAAKKKLLQLAPPVHIDEVEEDTTTTSNKKMRTNKKAELEEEEKVEEGLVVVKTSGDENKTIGGGNNTTTTTHRMARAAAALAAYNAVDDDDDDDSSSMDMEDRPGAIPVRGMGRNGMGPSPDEEEATVVYSMGGPTTGPETPITTTRPPIDEEEENLVEAELAPMTVEGFAEVASSSSPSVNPATFSWSKPMVAIVSLLVGVLIGTVVLVVVVVVLQPQEEGNNNNSNADNNNMLTTDTMTTESPTAIGSSDTSFFIDGTAPNPDTTTVTATKPPTSSAPVTPPYPSFSPMPSTSPIPSSSPSTSPSTMPSTSPTLLCHDIAVYRSPINDLTCDDHKDTKCLQWRFLGLNTTELGNLIESCPETCSIPCGSFNQFSIPITFRLSHIPGLLDDSNILTLEDTAWEHVIRSVAVKYPEIVFEIDDVNLKGQEQVEQESRFRRTRLRRLQENTATVDVTVWFTGFALKMTNEAISDLLSTTIEDADFAATLRNTEEFYDTVIITSARPDGAEPRRTGASSATIVVSALLSGSILCFALGSFIYHSRSGRWVPWSSSLRLATTNDIEGDIICHSGY